MKLLSIVICLLLAGCTSTSGLQTLSPKKATSRPYTIRGITYYPQEHYEYDECGVASHYGDGDGFDGKKTATGERFHADGMTAAHKTLPLPCVVRVTNMENGRMAVLKVNDRGPFIGERKLDVSRKAAKLLGFYNKGLAKVRIETLVSESLALNEKGNFNAGRAYAKAKSKPNAKVMYASNPSPKSKGLIRQAKATTKPGMYVQAATFSNLKKAKSMSGQMHHLAMGTPVRLHQIHRRNKNLYAVRLGPIKSSKDAQNLVKRINKSGYKNAVIVKE